MEIEFTYTQSTPQQNDLQPGGIRAFKNITIIYSLITILNNQQTLSKVRLKLKKQASK